MQCMRSALICISHKDRKCNGKKNHVYIDKNVPFKKTFFLLQNVHWSSIHISYEAIIVFFFFLVIKNKQQKKKPPKKAKSA